MQAECNFVSRGSPQPCPKLEDALCFSHISGFSLPAVGLFLTDLVIETKSVFVTLKADASSSRALEVGMAPAHSGAHVCR